MKSINEFIAASAVVIFPASVLVVDKVYGAVFLIVILLGIRQMVTYRKEIFPISKDEKLFFFSLCFVMVTVVITTVVNDTDMARADRFLALFLAIPAYYFFKRNLFDEKYIWIGLILGALIAAGTAIYQVTGLTYCPIKPVRAHGAVHRIIFGDLALLMGVMSLVSIGWFWQRKQWFILIPVLAFFSGILASVLSLTRGGWISLPFLFLVFIWFLSRKISRGKNVFLTILFILLVLGLYLVPQTGVQQRVKAAAVNIEIYNESQVVNDGRRYTPIGLRLEMWKASWLIFKDHPWVGVGWGEYSKHAQYFADIGLINKGAAVFYHPHNQYFSALAKGGVLGFIAVLVFYFIQIVLFYRSTKYFACPEKQNLALVGLLLITGFIGFGLTESILERSRSIIFLSFYLAVIYSFMSLKKDLKEV